MITSLPGHFVAYRYDADDGYTKMWAASIYQPTLTITRSGEEATLSWADPNGMFVLARAYSVEGPYSASDLPAPMRNGNTWSVTWPIFSEEQYFRLMYL